MDFLYNHISANYTDLKFVLICRDNNDYYIEKYFAYCFKALFWVSNDRYDDDTLVTEQDIKNVKDATKNLLNQKYSAVYITDLLNRIDKLSIELIKLNLR